MKTTKTLKWGLRYHALWNAKKWKWILGVFEKCTSKGLVFAGNFGPATENAFSPLSFGTSMTGWAKPFWDLKANNRILKWTLECTGYLWRGTRIGVMRSLIRVPVERRAAAFWTHWTRLGGGWRVGWGTGWLQSKLDCDNLAEIIYCDASNKDFPFRLWHIVHSIPEMPSSN